MSFKNQISYKLRKNRSEEESEATAIVAKQRPRSYFYVAVSSRYGL